MSNDGAASDPKPCVTLLAALPANPSSSRQVFHVCNREFPKLRCSVDLPSCTRGHLVTRSSQNVFAVEPSQQGRQGAHLRVAGGIDAHTRWATSKNAVSSGRA